MELTHTPQQTHVQNDLGKVKQLISRMQSGTITNQEFEAYSYGDLLMAIWLVSKAMTEDQIQNVWKALGFA